MTDDDPSPRWARRAGRRGPVRMRDLGLGPGALLIPALIAVFAAQVFWLPDMGLDHALSAQALRQGRWETLVTHMFLHGGLIHLFFNASALSALQTPVCDALGRTARGLLWFFVLYLLAGLAGAGAFLALNPDGATPVVGASGAICGLWGAASRVATAQGRLTGLFSRQSLLNLRNFTLMNLLLVGIFLLPQLLAGGGEMRSYIAWEAHAGGYLVGLLLVPWFQRRAGWTPPPVERWRDLGLGVPRTPPY